MEEKRKLPEYPIYETSYGSEIPIEQFMAHRYDYLPSQYTSRTKYNSIILEWFFSNGYVLETKHTTITKRDEYPTSTVFLLNDKKQIGVVLKVYYNKKSIVYELTCFFNIKDGEVETLIDLKELKKHEVIHQKSGINLVKMEHGHLDTEEYEMNVPDINLKLNYGSDFVKIHNAVIKRLNTNNDKGIVLFHGDAGTGKTTYIKYLTRLVNEKDILFVPPSMAESISDPSFIPFLMEHRNSILIIEDAERVIGDREGNVSSTGVSNLLNLTDGILGDCLNIQVIATFNMKKEKIDKALLRKGRLIAEHKFCELNVEDTNILLKHLKKNKIVDVGMTLADIYNIDEELFKSGDDKGKIGFNL